MTVPRTKSFRISEVAKPIGEPLLRASLRIALLEKELQAHTRTEELVAPGVVWEAEAEVEASLELEDVEAVR